jgi:hypothetical protein
MVAAGQGNSVSGNFSMAGGVANTVVGSVSAVIGGYYNCVGGFFTQEAAVVGGRRNTANGTRYFIGGGYCNSGGSHLGGRFNIFTSRGYAVGGAGNKNYSPDSVLLGGADNIAGITSGFYNAIVAGRYNCTNNTYATVIGGCNNCAFCSYSTAAGRSQSTSAACQFRVQALSKASGTFRIDHPSPEKKHTHYLSHSFVESPTAGDNIYRFLVNVENGTATIELPDYYKHLNTDDQVWVTPQGHFGTGYGIVNSEQTTVTIHANMDGEYNVLLIGTRKDFDAVHHWQGVESYK